MYIVNGLLVYTMSYNPHTWTEFDITNTDHGLAVSKDSKTYHDQPDSGLGECILCAYGQPTSNVKIKDGKDREQEWYKMELKYDKSGSENIWRVRQSDRNLGDGDSHGSSKELDEALRRACSASNTDINPVHL